ncbi:MAG TPA: glycosyltransferase family 4 protein [Stenomitos sp.]
MNATRLRIAQICPLWERVPPPTYGGIELVVSALTDELVRRGHEVTLFASGDSQTLARLEPGYPCALRLDPEVHNYAVYELMELGQVLSQADQFDIIHSHLEYAAHPFADLVATPMVHTLHTFKPDQRKLFRRYRHHRYISISQSQQALEPSLNFVGTVYNGIDVAAHPFYPKPLSPPYLAFVGRMSPEKGPHHAIAIAKQAGLPLKMAGKIDEPIRAFFESQVQPHIDGTQVEFLGEVSHGEKIQLLGQAIATLFPVTYEEPFGLVMVESMCTGTPVIGYALGSVPEVICHGRTGFVCDSYAAMPNQIEAIASLDRQACRQWVEDHFSVAHMTNGYEAAYHQAIATHLKDNP